jgi:sugar lactone lactonase YvrE
MSLNGSNPTTALDFGGFATPYYLYVDNNDNIYLSDTENHKVLLFLSNSINGTMVAGTGVVGFNNDQLNRSYGVFVNRNGTLYIADHWNHRIMKWFSGALSGIVAAGNGTAGVSSTQLNFPTQVIVDTNEYMYINEAGNSRITRWAPYSSFGVCIAACSGTAGTASIQLNVPHSLAFDSNGSLYVDDFENHRVQKFQILQYRGAYVVNLLTIANRSSSISKN